MKEDIIKESEKLPKIIKESLETLEKGKIIDKDWNDNNKLNSLINDCIMIENIITDINSINENIKKVKINNSKKIRFISEEK